jgi:hypothetical protein
MKKIKLSRLADILTSPMLEEDEVGLIKEILRTLCDLGYLNEERIEIDTEEPKEAQK